MKREFWFWRILILTMLIAIHCYDAHAESAIVSFDDAEHLQALTDSVVGVCDTVNSEIPTTQYIYPDVPYHYSSRMMLLFDGVAMDTSESGIISIHYTEIVSTITCRRLVCVTVVKNAYHGTVMWTAINGETIYVDATGTGVAIIFYEEVKR